MVSPARALANLRIDDVQVAKIYSENKVQLIICMFLGKHLHVYVVSLKIAS